MGFRDATVGYCGINLDDFAVGAFAPRPSWSWRLLHVGRIDDRKGVDTAIRALALLPDAASLEVVGRGALVGGIFAARGGQLPPSTLRRRRSAR